MSELKHYGTEKRSGRYPWGSGEDAYQRDSSFKAQVSKLRKQGLTDKEIWTGMGFENSTEFRNRVTLEKMAQAKADIAFATRLKEKGYSNVAIGERMGIPDTTVGNLLNPVLQEKALKTERTMDMLKNQVEKKKYLDVGLGNENAVGVSRTQLKTAIAGLEEDGYKVHYIRQPQLGTGKMTSFMVLTKDNVTSKEVWANRDQIRTITEWTEDKGKTYFSMERPISIDSKRISIKFAEDGGSDMDGVIQLRRGVQDISLGDKNYAQVRIAVDRTHYLKGMAIYSDDLPAGTDILFNTNKKSEVGKIGALKKVTGDPDNPFGSNINRQRHYTDVDGKDKLSAINIVNEEGDWNDWSKKLSSQMLSKQRPALAKQQLDISLKIKQDEFNDYASLTNPTVKKQLLDSFADDCDSEAVHLKAAALPRQSSHVILPSTLLKPNEIYAPNYKDGETVVLIRHPHGGIFEIPQLTVNNKNKDIISVLGRPEDAVAIHPSVAKKLSGADFDGDTVLVIPNKNKQVITSPSLKDLADFDPMTYKDTSMPAIKNRTKQTEMGKISNLITDMTIAGAPQDEIARAVKHSMVVIDSEKHQLNYKRSAQDNRIAELKKIYQGSQTGGAATLISRAKSEIRVPLRKDQYKVDPLTGKKIFIPLPSETYINKKGKLITKETKSTKMYETDDAFSLSSGTRMESIYAEYANSLKILGDKARKLSVETPNLAYSPSARKTYSPQVDSLNAQLSRAISNKPMERQAVLLSNKTFNTKRYANPDLTTGELKKLKGQELAKARVRVGAKRTPIIISPIEWEAIQAGAISNSTLKQILENADLKQIKQYATPRLKNGISASKLSRARMLFDRGYPQSEVAEMLGVSKDVLMDSLKPKEEGG